MDIVIFMYVTLVFVAGLVALAWLHWDTRDARKLNREIAALEERHHPAE